MRKIMLYSVSILLVCFFAESGFSKAKGPKGPQKNKDLSSEEETGKVEGENQGQSVDQNQNQTQTQTQTTNKNTKFNKSLAKSKIKKAEELRAVDHSESLVNLISYTADKKEPINYEIKILRSTNLRAYLDFLAPDYERGRKMLSIGKKYWSKFPDSKRVVEISRKEAIGNTAFEMGDLFQIDADKDYDPVSLGEEEGMIKIELVSKHSETTYDRIEYYLNKKDDYPVKAKFYSVSKKHIKTMYVEKSKQIAGMLRPSTLKMVDEINKGKYSLWITKTLTLKKIPEGIFSTNYLKGK